MALARRVAASGGLDGLRGVSAEQGCRGAVCAGASEQVRTWPVRVWLCVWGAVVFGFLLVCVFFIVVF